MRERDIIRALGDLGESSAQRIRHYIEEAFGRDLLSAQILTSLHWMREQGLVSQSGIGPSAIFSLTKEGKSAAIVEGWL